MTAPDPSLRQLWRHAATPARWLARLRQSDTLIECFEFDLRRAGLDAEVALEGLLMPVSLDAALGALRLDGSAPPAAGAKPQPEFGALPGRRHAKPARADADARPTTWPQHATATTTGHRFDPQSHPRLARLQTSSQGDLTDLHALHDLQRRYGLLDLASPAASHVHAAATSARAPQPISPDAGTPHHTPAAAQNWLRALAQRIQAPDAAGQPLAARNSRPRHDPEPLSRPPELRQTASPTAPRPIAAPDAKVILNDLQRTLERVDSSRAASPAHTAATTGTSPPTPIAGAAPRSVGASRPQADIDRHAADPRRPAAVMAAALRTGWRPEWPAEGRSPAAGPDPHLKVPAEATRQPAEPAQHTPAGSPTRADATCLNPSWRAPTGGFRGLAALGRAAAPATMLAPATASADSPAPRPFLEPGADTRHVGIDAEQLAELLRQQARRHGIDLTELEP